MYLYINKLGFYNIIITNQILYYPMTVIYLIRHAQSLFNAFGTLSTDIELSPFGKQQAAQLVGKPCLVIISPLYRARQTLEHSNIQYGELLVSDLCRERLDGNIINHFSHEMPSIESEAEFADRIAKFKALLLEKSQCNKYKEIYVITHALFIHRLTGVGIVNNCHKMRYSV